MEKKIKYIQHNEYLEVIFTGERSYEDLNDLMEEVHKKCEKTKIYKVLVDIVNAKGDWKEFDRFQVGRLASQFFGERFKILGVDKKEKINRFAENTAFNRGVNVFVTDDKKEGLDWLIKDK